jgi:DNA polymerase-1
LSLDDLAVKYLDYKTISYDEVTNKKKLNFVDVDLVNASIYSGEDVYLTWELYKKQMDLVPLIKGEGEHSEQGDFSILHDIEIPLIEVLKDMEIT